jgi:DHA1 family bicyclomycin/chloramphenicol resistance-like MFS transporter
MAASLQSFITGITHALTAGVIAPALSHSPRLMAIGMVTLVLCGLGCWLAARRLMRRRA